MDRLILKGITGDLELYENKIVLSRNKGCGCRGCLTFLTFGARGNKTIYIKNISAIELKEGVANSYIQFSLMGSQDSKGGYFQAAKDENTIHFESKYNEIARQIVSIIESKIQ